MANFTNFNEFSLDWRFNSKYLLTSSITYEEVECAQCHLRVKNDYGFRLYPLDEGGSLFSLQTFNPGFYYCSSEDVYCLSCKCYEFHYCRSKNESYGGLCNSCFDTYEYPRGVITSQQKCHCGGTISAYELPDFPSQWYSFAGIHYNDFLSHSFTERYERKSRSINVLYSNTLKQKEYHAEFIKFRYQLTALLDSKRTFDASVWREIQGIAVNPRRLGVTLRGSFAEPYICVLAEGETLLSGYFDHVTTETAVPIDSLDLTLGFDAVLNNIDTAKGRVNVSVAFGHKTDTISYTADDGSAYVRKDSVKKSYAMPFRLSAMSRDIDYYPKLQKRFGVMRHASAVTKPLGYTKIGGDDDEDAACYNFNDIIDVAAGIMQVNPRTVEKIFGDNAINGRDNGINVRTNMTEEAARRRRARDRLPDKVEVDEALTPSEIAELQGDFPFKLSFANAINRGHHAYSRVHRRLSLAYFYRLMGIKKDSHNIIVPREWDVLFKDIGGNPMQHRNSGVLCCHCCQPPINSQDVYRIENCKDELVKSTPLTDQQDEYTEEILDSMRTSKPSLRYCNQLAENCTIRARFLLYLHSSYDITIEKIGLQLDAAGAEGAYGCFIWHPDVYCYDSGYIPLMDADFKKYMCNGRIRIRFSFRGDPQQGYDHDFITYCMLTSKFTIPSKIEGVNYLVDYMSKKSNVYYFKIVRTTMTVQPSRPFRCLPLETARADGVVLNGWWYDTLAEGSVFGDYTAHMKPVRLFIPTEYYEASLKYALNMKPGRFLIENLKTALNNMNSFFISDGQHIGASPRMLDAVSAEIFAHHIYFYAYILRYEGSQLLSIWKKEENRVRRRTSLLGRIWNWVCRSGKWGRRLFLRDSGHWEGHPYVGKLNVSDLTDAEKEDVGRIKKWLHGIKNFLKRKMQVGRRWGFSFEKAMNCITVEEELDILVGGGPVINADPYNKDPPIIDVGVFDRWINAQLPVETMDKEKAVVAEKRGKCDHPGEFEIIPNSGGGLCVYYTMQDGGITTASYEDVRTRLRSSKYLSCFEGSDRRDLMYMLSGNALDTDRWPDLRVLTLITLEYECTFCIHDSPMSTAVRVVGNKGPRLHVKLSGNAKSVHFEVMLPKHRMPAPLMASFPILTGEEDLPMIEDYSDEYRKQMRDNFDEATFEAARQAIDPLRRINYASLGHTSRSGIKLVELLKASPMRLKRVVDLCGGPGGWANYLVSIGVPSVYGITNVDHIDYDIAPAQNFTQLYGALPDCDGDITSAANAHVMCTEILKDGHVDLVAADGCTEDWESDFDNFVHLLKAQVVLSSKILRVGGRFIMKLLTPWDKRIISLVASTARMFDDMCLYRLASASPVSSEVYAVFDGFKAKGGSEYERVLTSFRDDRLEPTVHKSWVDDYKSFCDKVMRSHVVGMRMLIKTADTIKDGKTPRVRDDSRLVAAVTNLLAIKNTTARIGGVASSHVMDQALDLMLSDDDAIAAYAKIIPAGGLDEDDDDDDEGVSTDYRPPVVKRIRVKPSYEYQARDLTPGEFNVLFMEPSKEALKGSFWSYEYDKYMNLQNKKIEVANDAISEFRLYCLDKKNSWKDAPKLRIRTVDGAASTPITVSKAKKAPKPPPRAPKQKSVSFNTVTKVVQPAVKPVPPPRKLKPAIPADIASIPPNGAKPDNWQLPPRPRVRSKMRCSICGEIVETKDFESHSVAHALTDVYNCEHCTYTTCELREYIDHVNDVHVKDIVKMCDRIEKSNDIFNCDYCAFVSDNIEEYVDHMDAKHMDNFVSMRDRAIELGEPYNAPLNEMTDEAFKKIITSLGYSIDPNDYEPSRKTSKNMSYDTIDRCYTNQPTDLGGEAGSSKIGGYMPSPLNDRCLAAMINAAQYQRDLMKVAAQDHSEAWDIARDHPRPKKFLEGFKKELGKTIGILRGNLTWRCRPTIIGRRADADANDTSWKSYSYYYWKSPSGDESGFYPMRVWLDNNDVRIRHPEILVSEQTVICNADKKAIAIEAQVANYKGWIDDYKVIQAGPGCMKSTEIVETHRADGPSFLVVSSTKETAIDLMQRSENHFGPMSQAMQRRYRTMDSVLINECPKAKVLYVDEALMLHFGEIVALRNKCGAERVLMYGDFCQIPFINRCDISVVKHHRLHEELGITDVRNVTFRLPADATAVLSDIYKKACGMGLQTASHVLRSVSYKYVTNLKCLAGHINAQIIGWGTKEKMDIKAAMAAHKKMSVEAYCASVRNDGFVPAPTAHEYEGKQADEIVVVRSDRLSVNPLYQSLEHAIVLFSRHKVKLTYYTMCPDPDALTKLIDGAKAFTDESLREYQVDPDKALADVRRKRKAMQKIGGHFEEDIEVDEIGEEVGDDYNPDTPPPLKNIGGCITDHITFGDDLPDCNPTPFRRINIAEVEYYDINTINFDTKKLFGYNSTMVFRPIRDLMYTEGDSVRRIFCPLSYFSMTDRKQKKMMQRVAELLNLDSTLRVDIEPAIRLGKGTNHVAYKLTEFLHSAVRSKNVRLTYSSDIYVKTIDSNAYDLVEAEGINAPAAPAISVELPECHDEFEEEEFDQEADINLLQHFISDEMGPVIRDTSTDAYMVHHSNIVLNCESRVKFNPLRGHYEESEYDCLQPELITPMPERRQHTAREVILAFYKRNAAVPQHMGDVNDMQTAKILFNAFFNTYIDKERFKALCKPINPTAEGIMRAQKNQRPEVIRNMNADVSMRQRALNKYHFGIKPDVKPGLVLEDYLKYAALQTIVYHDKEPAAVFCSMMRPITEIILACLKPHVFIYTDMSPKEFALLVSKVVPPIAVRGYKKLELDMSKFDKSQGRAVLLFECMILSLFWPEYMVRLWYNAHSHTYLYDMITGFSAEVDFQRKSGDASTFVFNTIFLMACLAVNYDLSKSPLMMFAGDDSLIFLKEFCKNLDRMANLFNLEVKLYVYSNPYFCSRFLLEIDDYNWAFVPNPRKLIIKLGRRDIINEAHRDLYFVSFADNVRSLGDVRVRIALARAYKERYPATKWNIESVAENLYYLRKYENFCQLYYRGAGANVDEKRYSFPRMD